MSRRASLSLCLAVLSAACSHREPSTDGDGRSTATAASAFTAAEGAGSKSATPVVDGGERRLAPPVTTLGYAGAGWSKTEPGPFAFDGCRALAANRESVAWSTRCTRPSTDCESSGLTHAEHVYLASKSGGPITEIVRHTGRIHGMALDEEHVYWTAPAAGRVRQARLGDHRWGGLAASRPSASPTALAADDTHVFWLDEGQVRMGPSYSFISYGAVIKVPKHGGAPVEIARDIHGAALLALDDTSVYWTDHGSGRSRRIQRAPKGGGPSVTLAESDQPLSLAVDEGFVYWADGNVVRRAPKGGGRPAEVFRDDRPGASRLRGLVVDRNFVFAASEDASLAGYVLRAPKGGGAAVRLGWFLHVDALAIDDDALWVCGDDGLYRVPAPDSYAPPRGVALDGDVALVAFLPDGRHLLGADSRAIHVLDPVTRLRKKTLLTDRFAQGPQTVLAFSPDGESVYLRGSDEAVERWNLRTGELIWKTEADPSGGRRLNRSLQGRPEVSLTDGGNRLLLSYFLPNSPGPNGLLVVLDTATGARVGEVRTNDVRGVALLPGGRVAIGGAPEYARAPPLRAWDVTTGEQVGQFDAPWEYVEAIAVSRDGTRVVTSPGNGLSIWDAQQRRLLRRIETLEAPRAIALLGAGARAVLSSRDHVCVWDLVEGEQLSCSPGLGGGYSLAVAPSGEEVAWPVNWPDDHFIRVWKIPTRAPSSRAQPR